MNVEMKLIKNNGNEDQVSMISTAVITDSISRKAGGLFWSVRALSIEATRNNCEVVVYAGEDEFSGVDQASWAGVELCVSKVFGPRAFGYQMGLTSKLKARKPDVIHLHGIWMYPSVANRQIRNLGIPYIISPHGMLDQWALMNSPWKKRLARFLYEDKNIAGATCIRALCQSEMDSIRALGVKSPIAVIPNGIDMPEKNTAEIPLWKKSIPVNSKVLFFLSRIHPKKGLPELLKAWSLCKDRKVNSDEWVLVISGWDQNGHEADLKQKCIELGIEDSVYFIGPSFDEDKEACFIHSDAFILPSLSEGLPMAILEAWSYGLPVLMTPECNLPEGFESDAAIYIKPDCESIIVGLIRLFNMNGADLKQMGIRGQQLVRINFQWGEIGKKMTEVYQWMLGKAPPPSFIYFYQN